MKAYYGSRIGENRTKTPEGFLVCHNTPIARIGWQDYLASELGFDGNNPVQVLRTEEDVFDPVAMASFEGKPVTDDHPLSEVVRPENIERYLRGVVTNVRRGSGSEADLLLADLIIYDAVLISEIESGKRETSCGYEYKLVALEDGRYAQKVIRGNHVAIVRSGRAGPRVRVKDSRPNKERSKNMSKINKNTIWGKMLSAFARDAEPEELAEASKMIQEKSGDETPTSPVETAPTGNEPAAPSAPAATDDGCIPEVLKGMQAITEAIKSMQAEISALKASAMQDECPEKALDELENEISQNDGSEESEESVTISSADEDEPAALTTGADSRAVVLAALKAVRPIVAQIPNPEERRKAADAMAKSFREQLQVQPTSNYRKMVQPVKPVISASDSKTVDMRELGRSWAKKWNPHYKNRD